MVKDAFISGIVKFFEHVGHIINILTEPSKVHTLYKISSNKANGHKVNCTTRNTNGKKQ